MKRFILHLVVTAAALLAAAPALAVNYDMDGDADIAFRGAIHTNHQVGYSVAMGDLNNDGNDDMIVGAPGYNEDNASRAGRVFILWGGQDDDPDVVIRTEGNQGFYYFELGYALAVGDVNGDQIDDLLVSALGCRNPELAANDAGAIFVFYGGGAWPAEWIINPYSEPMLLADVNVFGPGYSYLGSKIASGDLDNDGFDEIIGSEINVFPGGRVNVIFGETFAAEAVLSLPADGDIRIDNPPDPTSNYGLGNGLATGDVSGDGIDDLLMGTPGAWNPGLYVADKIDLTGHVYALFGQGSWPAHVDLDADGSDLDIVGVVADEANLGYAIAVGDVNGDGSGDVIMGAPDVQTGAPIKEGPHGTVYVVYGGGFSAPQTIPLDTASNRDITIHGVPDEYQHFGFSIAVGDMDADCIDDLIVGGWYDDNYANRSVFAIYGSDAFAANEVLTMPGDATHRVVNDPAQDMSYLGNAVAMGDGDGDTLADMLVGAMNWEDGDGANGAAFLVYSDEVYDPPAADAGPDQYADVDDTVTLDGSGSSGTDIGYSWTQVDGPAAALTDADTVNPSFTVPEEGTYTFALTVGDCHADDTDEVQVFVGTTPDDDDDSEDDDDDAIGPDDDEEDEILGYFGSGGCGAL